MASVPERYRNIIIVGIAAIFAAVAVTFVLDRREGPTPLEISFTEPTPGEGGPIQVYITGAVAEPGVYEMSDGDRVIDLLREAGGQAADANLEYFWDYYDVWTRPANDPTGWERNRVINIPDVLAVAALFGPAPAFSKEAALADALTPPPPEGGYNSAHNRGPVIGENHWDRAPPDSAINIVDDITGIAAQFGHNCFTP